jgi:copper chaperone CopZ
MTTIGMHVPDLTCAACDAAVRRALEPLPGVTAVEVRLEHKRVFVTFDEARVTLDDLRAAVARAGFEVG